MSGDVGTHDGIGSKSAFWYKYEMLSFKVFANHSILLALIQITNVGHHEK
jgi:hypothetical protein